MSTSFQAPTWRSYFYAHEDAKKLDNDIETLFACVTRSTDAKKLADQLTGESAITLISPGAAGNVRILHNVNKFHGGIIEPQDIYWALQGSETIAAAVAFDPVDLFAALPEEAKAPNELQLSSILTLDALTASKTFHTRVKTVGSAESKDARNIKGKWTLPIPPFLLRAIWDQDSMRAKDVFLLVNRKVSQLEEQFGELLRRRETGDKNIQIHADIRGECQPLLDLLWYTATASEIWVPCLEVIERGRAWNAAQTLHEQALGNRPSVRTHSGLSGSALGPSDATMQQLTSALDIIANSQAEAERKRLEEKAEKEKKNRFEKFPDSVKNLILNASSADLVVRPSEPSETYQEVLQADSAAQAKQVMQIALVVKQKLHMSVQPRLATAAYHGRFMWDDIDDPSNYSLLMLGRNAQGEQKDKFVNDFVLDLKAKQGQNFDQVDIALLTEQQLFPPKGVLELTEAFTLGIKFNEYIWGEGARIVKELTAWHAHITTYRALYERIALSDPLFCTKVLFYVDRRLQMFLQECSLHDNVADVGDKLIDCTDARERIIIDGDLSCQLPAKFKSKKRPKETEIAKSTDEDEQTKGTRRQRRSNGSRDGGFERQKHPNPRADWQLLPGEDYKKVFTPHSASIPSMTVDGKDTQICASFQVKGWCADTCKRAATHVQLSGAPVIAMDRWVRDCRKKAINNPSAGGSTSDRDKNSQQQKPMKGEEQVKDGGK